MQNTTLQFPSFLELWKFKERVGATSVVVLSGVNILKCELTQSEIALAINSYHAKIVEKQKA